MKKILFAALVLLAPTAHAGLYERITSTGDDKISCHEFTAAFAEIQSGNLTRNQVVAVGNLSASEATQLDAIQVKYDGFGTALAKAQFLLQFERTCILAEEGHYNKTKVQNVLGFTD